MIESRRYVTADQRVPTETSPYLPRAVDQQLDGAHGELPAVAIDGPRGVGKTATATRRARTVLTLDDPAHRELHLADPAFTARLLGLTERSLLRPARPGALPTGAGSRSVLGMLFESLVTASVRVHAEAALAEVFHLRTKGGEREVDLLLQRDDGRVVAVEVKLAASVDDTDVRHLAWLADRIGDDLLDAVVVTTGEHAYRRRDGIAVVPAGLLGA